LYSAAAAGAVLTGDALLELGSKLWGRALTGLTELVALAPELSLKAAGAALTLLTIPGNAGDRTLRVELNGALRFEQAPGEVGRLLELTADGKWQVIKTGVSLAQLGNQRVALTGDEIKALTAPLTNPSDPTPNPPLFTPMPSNDERLGELPGYEGAAPAGPTTTTTPIEWQSWDELIIERNSAEQKRFRGWLVDEAKRIDPNFDPSGYDAHHVITLKDYPELNALRSKLVDLGIDINDASTNGVLLPRGKEAPGTTPHGDTQNNPAYWERILERFQQVDTRSRAIEVLAEIRSDLVDGRFVDPKKKGP
jgi:hypothetical protein